MQNGLAYLRASAPEPSPVAGAGHAWEPA
jgi:hypothetical protein